MVSAQITSCVNESTLITKMNGYATNFSTAFSSILSNVSIPQADKTMRILGAVCNDSMYVHCINISARFSERWFVYGSLMVVTR
jgi:hypothetical protein